MKKTTKSALTIALALVVAPLAYAASVHFKGGNPTFTDQGTTLNTCLSLSGLGNGDVTITIDTTGYEITTCTNAGGNAAPGQNKTPVSPTAQVTVPSSQIKNGNLSVCLATTTPPTPTSTEAGCPNTNWTASLDDVVFTSAKVTVTQGGKVVLSKTFTL